MSQAAAEEFMRGPGRAILPTPEYLRWVTCEIAITALAKLGEEGGEAQLNKALAAWFPDADRETAQAIKARAVEHMEAYAVWLRNHSNRQIAAGKFKEGAYPS